MLKIALIDDYGNLASGLKIWDQLDASRFNLDFYDHLPSINVLKEYAVIIIIRERTVFTKTVLAQLPHLKHLALTGRASGQVDLSYAKEQNIAISITKGSRTTTAELTAALILAGAKNIIANHLAVQAGNWHNAFARELNGSVLGILGLGRLGSKVADFGTLFNMHVISWDSGRENSYAEKHHIQRLPLAELFNRSDFISIHLRLNEATQNLITYKHLSLMKPQTMLINTSRAHIIDQNDLYTILTERTDITAALDVYNEEPIQKTNPLRTLPNVIHSPHTGYVTQKVYEEDFFNNVITNIENWAAGKPYSSAL
ncbi:hypothetical protein COTS27_00909 [Spirochaetota bacterium]|nr:hypothetical protein COTS27_00909 [Spirochaetota bacterium]